MSCRDIVRRVWVEEARVRSLNAQVVAELCRQQIFPVHLKRERERERERGREREGETKRESPPKRGGGKKNIS
jgi:hypothetical protein